MKNISISLFLFFSGILTSLFIAEIAFRFLFSPPQFVNIVTDPGYQERVKEEISRPEQIILKQGINEDMNALYVLTPSGRRLRRNAHVIIENHQTCHCRAEIRTNSLGYRGPELGEKKTPRVLFLGDSITLADYIPEQQTWVHLIEERSKGLHPVETLNAGVWAIGLANEIAILKETGLATNPDVVIIGWYLNDVENSVGVSVIPVPFILQKSYLAQYLYKDLSLLFNIRRDEISMKEKSELWEKWNKEVRKAFPLVEGKPSTQEESFRWRVNEAFPDWGSAYSDGAWQVMYPLFVELKRLSMEHHFKLGIVGFPVVDQVYSSNPYDFPQTKLKGIGDGLNIPVLDLLPLFREKYREDGTKLLFYDWCHHTPYGNTLIADWVTTFLQNYFFHQR